LILGKKLGALPAVSLNAKRGKFWRPEIGFETGTILKQRERGGGRKPRFAEGANLARRLRLGQGAVERLPGGTRGAVKNAVRHA